MPPGHERPRGRRRLGPWRVLAVLAVLPCLLLGGILLLPPPIEGFRARGGPAPSAPEIPREPLVPRAQGTAIDGPEDLALAPDGTLVTGDRRGRILRIGAEDEATVLAEVGGRPLGLRYGPDGTLFVANHGIGLQAVDADGTVRLLADTAGSRPLRFLNGLAVTADGTVLVTDSSTRLHSTSLGPEEPSYLFPNLLEGSATGRVVEVSPSGDIRVLAEGLAFPNGIVLSRDERRVIVAESLASRLVTVERGTGAVAPLGPVLPGIPDNLSRGVDGTVLVGLYDRSPALDRLVLPTRMGREVVARLPADWFLGDGLSGSVLVIEEDGTVRGRFGALGTAATGVLAEEGEWFLGALGPAPLRRVADPTLHGDGRDR